MIRPRYDPIFVVVGSSPSCSTKSNIPVNPRKRKRPKRGRPFGLDKAVYRTIRSAVERFNGWIKNFRRIATRYERRLDCYAAFVHLACFLITSGVLR
jgi:transposase